MKKFNRALILLIPLIFISCATILNPTIQKIKITSDKSITNITIDSAKNNIKDNNNYYVLRDKRPLVVRFRHDTSNYEIVLKSKLSSSYFFNLYPGLWPGFLIDRNKSVKYTYPKRIHIEYLNDTINVSHFAPVDKGTINWVLSIPYINNFYVKTDNDFQNSIGFMGIGTGIEYYFKKNNYLSLNFGVASDIPIPFPAPIDYFGAEHHFCSTFYINLKNNFIINRFDVGYGLSYSNLNWEWSKGMDYTAVRKSKYSHNLGLCFESLYRFGESFRLGLLYQPSLIDISHKPTFDYQHFVSIEFIWKFPLT